MAIETHEYRSLNPLFIILPIFVATLFLMIRWDSHASGQKEDLDSRIKKLEQRIEKLESREDEWDRNVRALKNFWE